MVQLLAKSKWALLSILHEVASVWLLLCKALTDGVLLRISWLYTVYISMQKIEQIFMASKADI